MTDNSSTQCCSTESNSILTPKRGQNEHIVQANISFHSSIERKVKDTLCKEEPTNTSSSTESYMRHMKTKMKEESYICTMTEASGGTPSETKLEMKIQTKCETNPETNANPFSSNENDYITQDDISSLSDSKSSMPSIIDGPISSRTRKRRKNTITEKRKVRKLHTHDTSENMQREKLSHRENIIDVDKDCIMATQKGNQNSNLDDSLMEMVEVIHSTQSIQLTKSEDWNEQGGSKTNNDSVSNISQTNTIITSSNENKFLKEEKLYVDLSMDTINLANSSEQSSYIAEDGKEKSFIPFHVQNFLQVLNQVTTIHSHLLYPHEIELADTYKKLSSASQDIYTRLYNRQTDVFRSQEIIDRYLQKAFDRKMYFSGIQANLNKPESENNTFGKSEDSLSYISESSSIDRSMVKFSKEVIVIDDASMEVVNQSTSITITDKASTSSSNLIDLKERVWKELVDNNLVVPITSEDAILNSLKKSELLLIAKELKIKVPSNIQRDELVGRIMKEHKQTRHGLMSFFGKKLKKDSSDVSPLLRVIKKVLNLPTNEISHFYSLRNDCKIVFAMMHRLYFQNQSEDQTPLVLQNLKIFQHVPVTIRPMSMFHSREDFDEYEISLSLQNTLAEIAMQNVSIVQDSFESAHVVIEEVSKRLEGCMKKFVEHNQKDWPYFQLRFSAGWIYSIALFHGVAILEKLKMFDDAIKYLKQLLKSPYCRARRGKYYNRLSINLKHLKKVKKAQKICLKALKEDSSLSFANILTLEARLKQLYKSSKPLNYEYKLIDNLKKVNKKTIIGRRAPQNLQTKVKTLYVNTSISQSQTSQSLSLENYHEDDESTFDSSNLSLSFSQSFVSEENHEEISGEKELLTVEEVALKYYSDNEDLIGLHSEGSILRFLHGLIFWDIIYDDTVPGVWHTNFQVAPLDYNSENFFDARREKIIERLELMKASEDAILQMIELRFEDCKEYRSILNPKIFEQVSVETCLTLYQCIGGNVMSGICRIWCEDSRTHSGFPDLILWNETEKRALFSEVKGPKDRLSDKQRFWLNMLISFGANVEVCHVEFETILNNGKDIES